MARFYGVVKGQAKGVSTRVGGPKSGLITKAASWQGAVQVTLTKRGDVDWAVVDLVPHQGHGGLGGESHCIYAGPVSPDVLVACDLNSAKGIWRLAGEKAVAK